MKRANWQTSAQLIAARRRKEPRPPDTRTQAPHDFSTRPPSERWKRRQAISHGSPGVAPRVIPDAPSPGTAIGEATEVALAGNRRSP
jgi:hypothetical protein